MIIWPSPSKWKFIFFQLLIWLHTHSNMICTHPSFKWTHITVAHSKNSFPTPHTCIIETNSSLAPHLISLTHALLTFIHSFLPLLVTDMRAPYDKHLPVSPNCNSCVTPLQYTLSIPYHCNTLVWYYFGPDLFTTKRVGPHCWPEQKDYTYWVSDLQVIAMEMSCNDILVGFVLYCTNVAG